MENRKIVLRIIVLVMMIMIFTNCTGDTIASAYIWNDSNCNGMQDNGELPISNICINLVYYQSNAPTPSESECTQPFNRSNERGYWTSGAFVDCSDAYEVIRIPSGYELTTNGSNKGCNITFGLALEGTCDK